MKRLLLAFTTLCAVGGCGDTTPEPGAHCDTIASICVASFNGCSYPGVQRDMCGACGIALPPLCSGDIVAVDIPDIGMSASDAGMPAPDAAMPAPDAAMPAPDTGVPDPGGCYNPEGQEHNIVEARTLGIVDGATGNWVATPGILDTLCPPLPSDTWGFGLQYSLCAQPWTRFDESPGSCVFEEGLQGCGYEEDFTALLELQVDGSWEGYVSRSPQTFDIVPPTPEEEDDRCRYYIRTTPQDGV
jgi:hypothetical protein